MPPNRVGGRDWLIAIALAAVVLGLYRDVHGHDFVNYDDPYYVTENPAVLAGLTSSGVRWAFTTFEDGNWFPLTWISHMVDVSLWGVEPGAHHLTSVGLHALAAAFLFLVLRSMALPWAPSAFVAAAFAFHPLRVESVAWIAERKDVLAGLLSIVTLGAYSRYARRPGGSRYLVVCLAFMAALMAKAMPVTLPVVMLLLDWWPLRRAKDRSWPALVREKAPLFAIAAVAGVLALMAQSAVGATAPLASVPLGERLGNAAVSYVAYLGNTVWPHSLAVFYPRATPAVWLAVLSTMFVAAVTWLAWRERARHPYLIVGWLWFLIMLLPVIGLIQIGAQARADRYTYLPMIGIYVTVAFAGHALGLRFVRLRPALSGLATAALIACAVVTHDQLRVWRDSVSLFEHARRVTKPNYATLNNLGEALASRGDMARAVDVFGEATGVAPGNPAAHLNLAMALARVGQLDRAAAEYREVIRLQPENVGAHVGLGAAFMRQQRFGDAVDPLSAAVRLRPGDAMLRSNLASSLAAVGRLDEAIAQFEEALRLDPSLSEVRANLARARELKARVGRR